MRGLNQFGLGSTGSVFAIIFLYLAFKGAIDFVTVLPFEQPIFVFTHPAILLIIYFIVFFFTPYFFDSIFTITIMLCLPLIAATTAAFAGTIFSSAFSLVDLFNVGLDDYYEAFYTHYFSDFASKFKYFSISTDLARVDASYEAFMFMLDMVGGLCVIIAFCHLNKCTIGYLAKLFKKSQYHGLVFWLEAPINFIVLGISYVLIFPLIEGISYLQFGAVLKTLCYWYLMLLPILGINLAVINCFRTRKDKVATPITWFYMLATFIFFTVFAVDVISSTGTKHLDILALFSIIPIILILLSIISLLLNPTKAIPPDEVY